MKSDSSLVCLVLFNLQLLVLEEFGEADLKKELNLTVGHMQIIMLQVTLNPFPKTTCVTENLWAFLRDGEICKMILFHEILLYLHTLAISTHIFIDIECIYYE